MRRYIVPLLIVLAFWAVPTLAQRGGTRIDVRALIPTCTAITGSCPSNNYVCVQSTTIYRCVSPNTWTGIGGGGGSAHGNGANCSAGNYPLGVDADGAVEDCTLANDLSAADIDTLAELNAIVGDATLVDSALASADIDTLSELNAIVADATLVDSALVSADIDTLAEVNAIIGDATLFTGAHTTVDADHIDAITEIAAALKTGSDGTVVTGTATNGECLQWDANGDAIGSGSACGAGGGGFWDDNTTYLEPTDGTDDVRAVSIQDNNGPGTDWSIDTGGVLDVSAITDSGGSAFEIDTNGDITANTISVAASATPGTDYDDSDDATGTTDGSIDVNCPTTGDCDMALSGMVGTAATEFLNFDSDSTDAGGAPDLEVGINHTGTINVGASSTTTVTIDTDGTGDGELTVPAGSISASEIESQPAIDCTNCTNIPAGSHTGTIAWGGTSILETGTAFQFGDGTDATVTHTYANTGTDVDIAYSTGAMTVTGSLTATDVSADEFIPVREAGGEESSLKMYEDPDQAGDNYIELIAPDSITSNRTCTLEDDATPLDNCVTKPTHTACWTLFDSGGLAVTDDVPSVWRAPAAVTISDIWCEVDDATGTPQINVIRDDGTLGDVCTADISCSATGTLCTDASSIVGAEDNLSAGDRLDHDMVAVGSGPADRVNVCVIYTYD